MKFWTAFFLILKRAGIILILFSLSCSICEQFLSSEMQNELSSMEGPSSKLWIFASLSFLISILTPVFMSLFSISALLPGNIIQNILKNLRQVTIETLRASGSCLAWSLFFILPGFIRYIQLAFVNFVVILDPKYNLGELDALKASVKISKKSFLKILFYFIIFALVIPALFTAFDEWSTFESHPLTATLISILETVFSIIFMTLLFKLWEKANGTHVQLEAN